MLVFLKGALTGMAFGIVLYKVGASRFSRVMGMLTLRDTKVMKFTFVTIGVSSLVYGFADIIGVAETYHLVPRVMPFMGWAHLLGGVMFGAALGFTGFCPGTCFAKAGGGGGESKSSAPFTIMGLFAGVFLFSYLKEPLTEAGVIASIQRPVTLHGVFGLPYGPLALVWGAAFIGIALLVDRITPEKKYAASKEVRSVLDLVRGEWSWFASGVLAALLIILATVQDSYLGFSGALLAMVGWVGHLVGSPIDLVPAMGDEILWRAALIIGVFPGGAFAKWFSIPSAAAVEAPASRRFDFRDAFKGGSAGMFLGLGAMIGGGCTTGAYLAAWPTLSVGSLAMGGTFFAASMAVANLLKWSRRLDVERVQWIGDRSYD